MVFQEKVIAWKNVQIWIMKNDHTCLTLTAIILDNGYYEEDVKPKQARDE